MTTSTIGLADPADLEPSLLYERTYATRRRPTYIDAAVLLSFMFLLLAFIPAREVLPGATDVGRPALVVGFLLFLWWVVTRFHPGVVMLGPQPIRWAFFAFFGVLLIGYAVGFLRGLTSMEANAADRTMLYFCTFGGAVLTAADGLPNWLKLRTLLKVLVVSATFVAAFGLVEYVLQRDLSNYLLLPGLQEKGWVPVLEDRGSGVRVASTTSHYIEMAAYLALVLPFAIHFAIFSRKPKRRWMAIAAAVIIAAGIASTISRTGIIAEVIMFLALIPLWTWRMRYNIGVGIAILIAGAAAGNGGLTHTLLHLFDNPTNNSSISARYERYPLAFRYIGERPWLGRGTGTWVSPQYQIMDNQWLETLLSNGFVGAAAYLALHVTAISVAWLAMRRSPDREVKHLCAALISTQFMGLIVAATFDSLAFLTFATTLALTIGMCGTVWRLTHPQRMVRTSATRAFGGRAG
ncbi:O-antigen ligase family protein [Paractinoplanes globisporus]|uniref:O-antigen ligase family protein n=1 Tax=Paractinoplanes globisporus TaxID=113565 RepID=A0ABW6W606_9ACTN|nr:O-antigen ligase family protein [Actinoplanes globisporus]